jgi:hypothetical protein
MATRISSSKGRDEERLIADIIELAGHFGRYGRRKVPAMPRDAVWL